MKVSTILTIILALISLALPACDLHKEGEHQEHQKIVLTSPEARYVTLTQEYVCQIHSQRHINVRALQDGYLQEIRVKEGQAVKKDDVLFTINPTLYEARYDAELAEARLAQIEYDNTLKLYRDNKVVSIQEVYMHQAKLDRAKAKVKLAKREVDFCIVKAPFPGIIDKLQEREGSLIKERDILTTLSDNSVLWVYFNVPEKRYYEYLAAQGQGEDPRIELVLADGSKFSKPGKIGAIEAKFNNETGNIPFRADFENEYVQVNGLKQPRLRHGQTGNVLIHRTLKDAIVIPQRAVFEIMDKRYVYVVDKDDVVHQRDIVVQHELEDIFVIQKGLEVNDRIVLEGVREVHDGQKVEFEFRPPHEAMANQKNQAE